MGLVEVSASWPTTGRSPLTATGMRAEWGERANAQLKTLYKPRPEGTSTLYISEIKITDFRSCAEVRIPLRRDVTVLAGENNAGKTTAIEALRHLTEPLDGHRPPALDDTDLNRHAIGDNVRMTVRLEEVSAGQAGTYIQGLTDGLGKDGMRTVAWSLSAASAPLGRRRGRITWSAGLDRELKGEPEFRQAVRHVHMPALRDAVRELGEGGGTRLRVILEALLGSKEAIAEFVDRIHAHLGPVIEDDTLLKLRDRVSGPLESITAGTHRQRTELEPSASSLASIARSLRMLLGDSHASKLDPVRSSGLGYANVLYMATVLAELETAREADLTMLLVEEPEAHLHPQLQTLFLRYLKRRAEESRTRKFDDPAIPAGHIQVVISTHSPVLSAAVSVENIVVMIRRRTPGNTGWESGAVPIAELGLKPKEIRELDRYLDVTKNTLLFGPRALLVEGMSEALLLPVFAELVLGNVKAVDKEVARRSAEALERFHGTTLAYVEGVNFAPYLRALLTPVSDVRVAHRVAVITDTDQAPEKGEPSRITNIRAMAAGLGVSNFDVFAAAPTLEPSLLLPENEEILSLAFQDCAPNSRHRWEQVQNADPEERPAAFGQLFREEGPGTTISKPEFAHALADRLSPDCGFVVPGHLANAIRFISAPDPDDEATQ